MKKALLVFAALAALSAQAADKVKVGFISTLSGPNAAIGGDIRDGFNLAIKLNGGKLGTLPAEVLVGDDQFKPENAKQLAERYLKLEKVDFLTGGVFSNISLRGWTATSRCGSRMRQTVMIWCSISGTKQCFTSARCEIRQCFGTGCAGSARIVPTPHTAGSRMAGHTAGPTSRPSCSIRPALRARRRTERRELAVHSLSMLVAWPWRFRSFATLRRPSG